MIGCDQWLLGLKTIPDVLDTNSIYTGRERNKCLLASNLHYIIVDIIIRVLEIFGVEKFKY